MASTARGLGARLIADPRDKNYPLRLRLDPLREEFFPHGIPLGSTYNKPGRIWVQGDTGTCVEHGARHFAEGGSIMQELRDQSGAAYDHFSFYRKIIGRDEWSDNDHEVNAPIEALQSGTSVRAALDQMIDDGMIKSYLWAESVLDIRAWLSIKKGGFIIGIPWKTDMMDADSSGVIRYRGNIEGGHCVWLYGWNDFLNYNGRKVPAARGQQSWPLPWGDQGRGRFWILADDLENIYADQGEFGAPQEVRVTPLKVA